MAKDKDKGSKKPRTDLDKSREALDEVGKGLFSIPKEGKNVYRIVPWKAVFFFKAILHYGFKRAGGTRDMAYPCLLMFGKKSCPICDYHEDLSKSGSENKQKLASRIRGVTKYYVNILDRGRVSDGIKVYGLGMKMMRTLKGYLEDEDYGDITDPEEGRDIIITREGTTFTNTSYDLRVRAKSSPLDYDGWEDEIHNLEEEIVKEVDKDFLEKQVKGLKKLISGKSEEDGEEDKPKNKRREEEEEEEEDEPDFDEMSKDEMLEVIKEDEVDIENPKKMNEVELRKALKKAWKKKEED